MRPATQKNTNNKHEKNPTASSLKQCEKTFLRLCCALVLSLRTTCEGLQARRININYDSTVRPVNRKTGSRNL